MSAPAVWVNGSFDARIDPLDRGFSLGDGIFDTLTAFNRIPFAGDRHLQRLTGQAAAIGIPLDAARVREGWNAVLGRGEAGNLILRTTVTRGIAARGLWPLTAPQTTIAVSAAPWSPDLLGKDVRLITSSIRRNPASPSAQMKTLGYLDHVLAAREAAKNQADDALFLNVEGNVACTTIANVFAIVGKRLVTPALADGVMPGIMRALLMEAAGAAGLLPEEQALRPADLISADAVVLTNSVRFLSSVRSLDGHPLGRRADTAEASLRSRIAAMVRDACGFDLPALR